MIDTRRWGLARLVAAALILCSLAAPAMAAQAPAPKAPPGTTDVQIWPEAEPGRNVTVASVTVPETTKLPVTVQIPIPPDAQVVWAGEILGGDPSQDPKRTFKVVNGVGGTVAQFELSEARTGQIEAVGGPVDQKDGVFTVATRWVQAAPSKLTGIAVRLPVGATSVVSTPAPTGAPDKNESGESLYPLPARNFKVGEGETVTVSWKIVPAASQSGQQGGATNPVPIIVGLLAGAVVILAVVLFSQRNSGSGEAAEAPSPKKTDSRPERERSSATSARDEDLDDEPFDDAD